MPNDSFASVEPDDFDSVTTVGGSPSRPIDPRSIGSDANIGDENTENSGDGSASNNTGNNFRDGYGPAGEFGKGRFPDGTSRKRSAQGTRTPSGSSQGADKPKGGARRGKALDPAGIEVLLIGIHAGVSALVERSYEDDERILPLGGDDAKRLAIAMANVARHYPQLETSAKVFDHIQLMTVAATIYGPMAMLFWMRAQEEKRQARSRNMAVSHG